MKKILSHALAAGVLAAALFALPASAQDRAVGCSYYQPGMLAFMIGARPAPCAYQGDYMVNHGPVYDGPARRAPQPTYAPAPTASNYPYVHGQYKMSVAPATQTAVVRRSTVKGTTVRSKRVTEERAVKGKRMTVEVKNELPPTKGKPKVVKAQAEVRIYGPDRMEIRLFRR